MGAAAQRLWEDTLFKVCKVFIWHIVFFSCISPSFWHHCMPIIPLWKEKMHMVHYILNTGQEMVVL